MAVASPGPRDGGESAGHRSTSVKTEKEWLELWAFATSPYGLGISSEILWTLDNAEYHALKYQWALAKAQTINLQAATEGVPFIPEDFLGLANRELRLAQAKVDKDVAEVAAAMENAKLLQFRSGAKAMDDSGIPAWMKNAPRRRG